MRTTRLDKKQENMVYNQEKSRSVQTDPGRQRGQSSSKGPARAVINLMNMPKFEKKDSSWWEMKAMQSQMKAMRTKYLNKKKCTEDDAWHRPLRKKKTSKPEPVLIQTEEEMKRKGPRGKTNQQAQVLPQEPRIRGGKPKEKWKKRKWTQQKMKKKKKKADYLRGLIQL